MRFDMKILKFRSHLATAILDGRKTSTWRLFDDKDLSVGDILELEDSDSRKKFANAKIIAVREKTLGQVEESDFNGHDAYSSPGEMLKSFQEYYGNHVTLETPVKIVEFKVF